MRTALFTETSRSALSLVWVCGDTVSDGSWERAHLWKGSGTYQKGPSKEKQSCLWKIKHKPLYWVGSKKTLRDWLMM